MELMGKLEQVKLLERDLDAKVKVSYPVLKNMLITVGRDRANALSQGIEYRYDLKEKRVMAAGMNLPSLEITLPEPELKYLPARSFAECDEVTLEFFRVLRILTERAALRTMVWTLARELRKTQRRVNALDKIVIPAARETRAYIEAALEEKDRDAFFTSKLLKKKARPPARPAAQPMDQPAARPMDQPAAQPTAQSAVQPAVQPVAKGGQ
jgi:V/A-type H+-transporting ATPase subunit D